jgi:hypothetical protein
MQQPELKRIGNIGDTMAERLARDHRIETIAATARLNDTEVDELQQAPQAARSQVRKGEVARCRHQARQLVSEEEAVADEPLATFVVEAWRPSSESDNQPHFVVHHVEADETLATSVPRPTIDDAMRWMQERVTMPGGQLRTQLPAEREEVTPVSAPEQPTRRGRLQITGLEVRLAEHDLINGAPIPLLASTPVAIEAGGALVFAADVSLEGADHPVTCQMRCRLHRIESQDEVAFTWSSETNVTPGMPSTTTSSSPVPIPAGAYRGEFFAEDPRHGVSRAFRQIPLLIVI